MQQYQQQIEQASQTAEAYFDTRRHEADYEAKMKQIHAYFADPARVQEFVATYEPRQWFAQFKFMYDNIRLSPQARSAQPIRSRPMIAGMPAANGAMDNPVRLMQHLENMGI